MIGAVDWHLLLLFACLFGVTAAFAKTGLAQDGIAMARRAGAAARPPRRHDAADARHLQHHRQRAGRHPDPEAVARSLGWRLAGLALLSTFAGNLLLTGSLCNIIVAERAAASGARSSFMDFARSGIPMTLASLAVTVVWLWVIGLMPA